MTGPGSAYEGNRNGRALAKLYYLRSGHRKKPDKRRKCRRAEEREDFRKEEEGQGQQRPRRGQIIGGRLSGGPKVLDLANGIHE